MIASYTSWRDSLLLGVFPAIPSPLARIAVAKLILLIGVRAKKLLDFRLIGYTNAASATSFGKFSVSPTMLFVDVFTKGFTDGLWSRVCSHLYA